MRAHWFQHVAFEGLGSIEPWLKKEGFEVSVTKFHLGERPPEMAEVDFLIVMGGPMSVNDVKDHPWIPVELEFIRKALEKGLPILGICLGAQFIARASGSRVYANSQKEIGWHPVEGLSVDQEKGLTFQKETLVFHWHGETFDLPEGAVLLARSEACEHQAFLLGDTALGIQFHLETTAFAAKSIVENCRHELVKGRWIQSKQEILSASPKDFQSINKEMEKVLDFLKSKMTRRG